VWFVVQKIVEAMPAISTEDAACERCGSFDVVAIAGQFLCAGCVILAGSSCCGAADGNGG
jgi:hypothetical protein